MILTFISPRIKTECATDEQVRYIRLSQCSGNEVNELPLSIKDFYRVSTGIRFQTKVARKLGDGLIMK